MNIKMMSLLVIFICAPFAAHAELMCVDDWNCSGVIELNTGRSPDSLHCKRVLFNNGDTLLETEFDKEGKHYSSRSLIIEPNHIEISQDDAGISLFSIVMHTFVINLLKTAYPNGPDTVPDGKMVKNAKILDANKIEQLFSISTDRVNRHQINYSFKSLKGDDKEITGLWNDKLPEPLPDDFSISGWSNSAKAQFKNLSEARLLKPDYKGYKVAKGFTITPLDIVGGVYSRDFGTNNVGQLAGSTSNGITLWINGKIEILDNPGKKLSTAKGINSIGQVVGVIYPDGYGWGVTSKASFWNRGKMQDLGALGGKSSEANAINNVGQIVGFAQTAKHSVWHAVLWENGKIQDLDPLGNDSHAYGININGQIVGEVSGRPVIWNNGIMQTLSQKTTGCAYAINDVGQVTGSVNFNGNQHAVLWSNGKMLDLDPLGTLSSGTSINNLGH